MVYLITAAVLLGLFAALFGPGTIGPAWGRWRRRRRNRHNRL